LFISKSIIEAHGGKIWAKNNKDRGSTFMFTLPITNLDSVRDDGNQI
jgi:signal transduction histidine kinase